MPMIYACRRGATPVRRRGFVPCSARKGEQIDQGKTTEALVRGTIQGVAGKREKQGDSSGGQETGVEGALLLTSFQTPLASLS